MSFEIFGFNSGYFGHSAQNKRKGVLNNIINDSKKKENSSQFNNIGKIAMTKTNLNFINSFQYKYNKNYKENIKPSSLFQDSKNNNKTDVIKRNFLNMNYNPIVTKSNEMKNKTFANDFLLSNVKVSNSNDLDYMKNREKIKKLPNPKTKISKPNFPPINSLNNQQISLSNYINNINQVKQKFIPYSSQSQEKKISFKNNTSSNFTFKKTHQTINSDSKNYLKKIYSLKKYSSFSLTGSSNSIIPKINQDSYIIREERINNSIEYIFGVFDGHGIDGHFVSQSIKQYFQNEKIINLSSKEKLLLTFQNLSNYIQTQSNFDTLSSGSTCTIIHISDNKIIIGNTGDSRSILITKDNKIILLSNDHKPNNIEERKRIEEKNGRVSQTFGMGPFRVFLKNENFPGLAMSRSIGDKIAHSVGVSDIPEILEFDLDIIKPKAFIVASDGIWEFLSNEDVKNHILNYIKFNECELCTQDLCFFARKIWEKSGYAVDDITAIIGFFEEI